MTVFTGTGLLLLVGVLAAAEPSQPEQWRPHAHPATLTRQLHAFTAPAQQLALAAEFPARIAAMPVAAGEIVKDGAVLVQLDQRRAELSLQTAEAAVAIARAQLATLAAEHALAERDREFQAGEVRRIETLAGRGQVQERQLDQTRLAADQAVLAVQSVQARQQVGEAELAARSSQLADAQEVLNRHRLYGPAGWQIAERHLEPGAVVPAGQAILTLVDTGTLKIELHLGQAEVAALRQQQSLQVRFPGPDGTSGTTAEARLHRIDPRFDPVTNKRLVELRLPGDAAPEASGGLAVLVPLVLPAGDEVLVVPMRFVTRRYDQLIVQLADGSSKSLQPLRHNDEQVLVAASTFSADDVLILPRP